MTPDPNFSPEELAAFNAIQDLLAQVDKAFGVTGKPYFLGLADAEPVSDPFSEIELEAIAQINAVLYHADDVEAYRPLEPAEIEMFSLFAAHDPLQFDFTGIDHE